MGRNAFRLWSLAALILGLAAPARAGVERWVPFGPPEGLLVTMAVDGGRLLAATGESGVFASTDKGLTWFRSSEGMDNEWIEAIVLDSDDHTLYAAGRRRFFQSVDAGAHWAALGTLPAREEPGEGEEPFHDVLVLAPGEPDAFLLSFGKTLYHSTDGGRTWASVLAWTSAIQSVQIDPNDPRSLFVGTGGSDAGLLHSPAAGATWTPVTDVQPAGLPPVDRCIQIFELTVDPRPGVLWAFTGKGLYRSKDGGLTWNPSLQGGWPTNRDFMDMARLDDRTILVSGSGMWRSGDRGATWTRTMSRFVQHNEFDEPEFQRYLYRLRAEPGNPKVVYAEAIEFGERHPPQDFQYIYQSLDGGITWHRLVENVFALAFDPAQPRTLYGLGGGALLRSTDRGRHWKKITDRPVFSVWDSSDLMVDPNDSRVLYLARSGFRYGGPREELGVWRSTDGGITWAPLRLGMGPLPVDTIVPDPRQPGRLFATSSEGLFVGRFALPED